MGSDQLLTYHRHAKPLEALRDEIEASGRRVHLEPCDTRDPQSVRHVLDIAQRSFGRVHGVVSATGLAYEFRQLADQSAEAFREVIETDILGFFNIAKAAVAAMRGTGGGSIVAVGTSGVDRTVHGNTLSSVPKSAVARMIRFLALEEGRHGIRANLVGAGLFRAGMTLVMEEQGKLGKVTLEDFAHQAIPLRRPGKAEELAEVVAFLASPRASYVTGQIMHVDGGLSA